MAVSDPCPVGWRDSVLLGRLLGRACELRAQVLTPTTQETRFTAALIDGRACAVACTGGLNEVPLVEVGHHSIRFVRRLSPGVRPQLLGVRWGSIGIALEFVSPPSSFAFAEGLPRLLIAQDDEASDDLILLVLPLETYSSLSDEHNQARSWNLVRV